jgi:hypothetical protein
MKAFLLSLSLGYGAFVAAVCSTVLAWPLSYVRSAVFRWLGAVLVPLVLAYVIYSLPVWLGANPSEYFSWAFLIVGAWFLIGFVPSVMVLLILGKCRTKRHA